MTMPIASATAMATAAVVSTVAMDATLAEITDKSPATPPPAPTPGRVARRAHRARGESAQRRRRSNIESVGVRLLHTSDWHLGRTFHGADLLADQQAVLAHLADVVRSERVDVVLVSGDVYDRAVPSAETVQVATRGLARIREAGAQIVVTSGNHDSAMRLGAFADFLAAGGLHLRTSIDTIDDPVVLSDEHGQVAIYGIPYLEPEPARQAMGIEAKGHTGVLTEAMRRVNADRERRGSRSVVMAHAFVTGGTGSDSERSIAVGGVEQVGGAVFDGPDYVALGHLHGPQTLTERMRYSG